MASQRAERMPRHPYQDDRGHGHRGRVDQHPRQQVERIPRKAGHHDDHPADGAHPEDRPRHVAAHDSGGARTPAHRETGRVARHRTHGHSTSNDGPDRMRLSGGSAPDGLRISPNDSGASTMPLGSPTPVACCASKGAVMRKATTKRQDHTVTAMDGVGAFSGAAQGPAGGRRRMNAMDRIGAFSGAAYVLLANLGSALIGVGPNGAESPGQRILDEQQRIAENPWTERGVRRADPRADGPDDVRRLPVLAGAGRRVARDDGARRRNRRTHRESRSRCQS